MEQFREKSRIEPALFLDSSNSYPTDNQESETHIMSTSERETSISPLKSTTPHFEERFLREEETKEFYLPLVSTVVFKRKQEMLFVPLDFDNNLKVDTLVDSRAYVVAFSQNELDTIKQKAPNKIFEIDNHPNFQIQVAKGQLGKP